MVNVPVKLAPVTVPLALTEAAVTPPDTLALEPVITPPTVEAAVTVPVALTLVAYWAPAYKLLNHLVELPRFAVVLANGKTVFVERLNLKNSLADWNPKPNTMSRVVPTLPVATTKLPPNAELPCANK